MTTGDCLNILEGHIDGITSVHLSSDDRYVLSGSRDNTARLWDVETGKCLRIFKGHTHWVNQVYLSNDSRYILSASEDGSLRIWELDWELDELSDAERQQDILPESSDQTGMVTHRKLT